MLDLALFPQQNPNPVLSVSAAGELLYANAGASPLLAGLKLAVGQLTPPEWRRVIDEALGCGSVRELVVAVGGRAFAQTFVPIREACCVNIYAYDMTERKRAEEALDRERALLRTVIDMLPDPIYAKDLESRFVLGNISLAQFLKVGNPENLIGKSDKDFYPQEKAAGFRNDELAVLNGGAMFNEEESFNSPDGTQRFVLSTKVPLKDADGKIIGLVGIGRDITERKRAEEKFDRERTLLRTVIDLLPDPIYVKDLESRFVLGNIGAAQNMGAGEPENLIGKSDKDFFPQEQAAGFRNDELAVLNGGAMFNKEESITRPDGTRLWFLTIKVPLKDAEGKIIGLVGIGRDITERKRAEDALDRERALLRAVIDLLPDHIYVKNIESRFVLANNGLARVMLGAPKPELLIGKFDSEFYSQNEATEFRSDELAVLNGHAIFNKEEPLMHPDGTRRFILTTKVPLKDSKGNIVGVIGIGRDITARKRAEAELQQLRQVQKMESVGQLAAGIAHDFNNLLTVIQGYSDLLHTAFADQPRAAECVEQIAGAGERAANLTRQLLLFSRKQVAVRHLLDVNELTGNLTRMLGRILGEDIDLRLEFRPGIPPVYADTGMIEQVITNLSVNARDAMPEGGRLEITTSVEELDASRVLGNPEARPGRFVCLAVRDTGSGIALDDLPKIFEPFFTTKEVGKGTGLELATVYGIVMQHQGVLEVASEPGKGTCFRIFLPAATRAEEAATAAAVPAPVRGGSETILLVEDESLVLLMVERILAEAGYTVLIAASAAAAREVWREHWEEIDLLLTDMVMPGGFSGKQLAEVLRGQNRGLRVIFMSGYSAELQSRDLDIKEGIRFLQKPFTQSVLLEAVRRQLDSGGAGQRL